MWRTDSRLQRAAQEADDFIIAARRLVNVGCLKHWPKAVPPKPDRFMAYVNASFIKKVLYIKKRKCKTNIQHDCKSDDFRAGFKVAKWGVFVIQARYKLALPASSKFNLTKLNFQVKFPNKSKYGCGVCSRTKG